MTIKFTRRSVCALGAAALGCAAFPPFAAEDPIRIIVPYPCLLYTSDAADEL